MLTSGWRSVRRTFSRCFSGCFSCCRARNTQDRMQTTRRNSDDDVSASAQISPPPTVVVSAIQVQQPERLSEPENKKTKAPSPPENNLASTSLEIEPSEESSGSDSPSLETHSSGESSVSDLQSSDSQSNDSIPEPINPINNGGIQGEVEDTTDENDEAEDAASIGLKILDEGMDLDLDTNLVNEAAENSDPIPAVNAQTISITPDLVRAAEDQQPKAATDQSTPMSAESSDTKSDTPKKSHTKEVKKTTVSKEKITLDSHHSKKEDKSIAHNQTKKEKTTTGDSQRKTESKQSSLQSVNLPKKKINNNTFTFTPPLVKPRETQPKTSDVHADALKPPRIEMTPPPADLKSILKQQKESTKPTVIRKVEFNEKVMEFEYPPENTNSA